MPDIAPITRVHAGDRRRLPEPNCSAERNPAWWLAEQRFHLCEIAALDIAHELIGQNGRADEEKVERDAEHREGDHDPAEREAGACDDHSRNLSQNDAAKYRGILKAGVLACPARIAGLYGWERDAGVSRNAVGRRLFFDPNRFTFAHVEMAFSGLAFDRDERGGEAADISPGYAVVEIFGRRATENIGS